MPGPRQRRTGSWNGPVLPKEMKGLTGAEARHPSLGCACHFPLRPTSDMGRCTARPRSGPAQASRYQELARARLEHRQHYGDLLIAAIAANPPRGRDPLWTQRDLKTASGRATHEDIEVWAQEAKALAEEENCRRKAWSEWVASSWSKSPGEVYAWCRTERPAPILSTTDAQKNWLLEPNGIALEAARQWGRLWKPPPHQEPQALPFAELPHMPPLTSDLLWDVVRHIPRAKAQGLDAWPLDDLNALPREAFYDLAGILAQVEAEGKWPEGLSGAIVALLPKKDDHGPLAQRPISLLPMGGCPRRHP